MKEQTEPGLVQRDSNGMITVPDFTNEQSAPAIETGPGFVDVTAMLNDDISKGRKYTIYSTNKKTPDNVYIMTPTGINYGVIEMAGPCVTDLDSNNMHYKDIPVERYVRLHEAELEKERVAMGAGVIETVESADSAGI